MSDQGVKVVGGWSGTTLTAFVRSTLGWGKRSVTVKHPDGRKVSLVVRPGEVALVEFTPTSERWELLP